MKTIAIPLRSAALTTVLAALLALGGCSVLSSGTPMTTYDLGPLAAPPAQPPAPLPKLRVAQTDGPEWMEGSALYYRLQYAQAQRLQAYATQRWVEPAPRLFDERLREAVASRGSLNWYGDTSVPAIKVDLLAFEQVFDSATSSRGLVRARVTVFHRGLIGQKTFVAEQPAPSADGAGGVRALAASTDAVIAAILDWAATLPLDRNNHGATGAAASAPPVNPATTPPRPAAPRP
ncbi:ABC-type transport auxiliary lipoprotein family protein [Cupriavidus sp. Marseille-Q8015]